MSGKDKKAKMMEKRARKREEEKDPELKEERYHKMEVQLK